MTQGRSLNDVGSPRGHLANERTHLAWMRTALTVVVLGLAVARFGDDGTVSAGSVLAGGILVIAGGASWCTAASGIEPLRESWKMGASRQGGRPPVR
ncbi:YidH family protein [Aeromicrobium endophyticum]|uniref:DUF202 domain-containing protein n=1 Tax=Aeromicrobium endophyticum TaxID=2292704 RepID=A0A371PB95_9ACTN|nr:DUF202 domain-containing protein [Aeromicrobium endophyticum]